MCWCVFRNRRRFAAVKKGYTAEWRHTEWRTQTQLAKPHTKRDISLVGWLIIRPENDSLRLCACFCPKAVWPHGLILLHGQFYCLVILTRNDRIISFNNKWIVCLYILLWICRFSACAVPQQRSVFFFFFFYRYFLANGMYNVHVHRTASHNICRESTQFFADFAKAVQTKLYSLPTIWYELENRDLFIKRSPLPLMFCSKTLSNEGNLTPD